MVPAPQRRVPELARGLAVHPRTSMRQHIDRVGARYRGTVEYSKTRQHGGEAGDLRLPQVNGSGVRRVAHSPVVTKNARVTALVGVPTTRLPRAPCGSCTRHAPTHRTQAPANAPGKQGTGVRGAPWHINTAPNHSARSHGHGAPATAAAYRAKRRAFGATVATSAAGRVARTPAGCQHRIASEHAATVRR